MNQEERNAWQRERRKMNGNAATKKYEKTVNGFLMRTYRNMKSRVDGVQKKKRHLYEDKPLTISKELFYAWSKNNAAFVLLFGAWEAEGYDRKLTPSIDRINPQRGYEAGNIRWITHSENSRLGGLWKPSEHKIA